MGIMTILAATLENPKYSFNDPTIWDALLGGRPVSSGVHVTRANSLSYSPWWRGIALLSADVGKLPLLVYKTTAGDTRLPEPRHASWKLLRRKPNQYMTAFTFKELLTSHALQTGNGYAAILRRGDGTPAELIPLDPETVTPAREDGVKVYVVRITREDGSTEDRKLADSEVLHVQGLGYDGLTGYSVWELAKESIGLGLGVKKYGSVFFRNNARPSVAIEVPGRLTDAQQKSLKDGWEAMHAGLDNAHRVAILQGGAKLTPFSVSARDAQMLEVRQFEVREVANFLGIPVHKLADVQAASGKSREQDNQEYLDTGLGHWLTRWEEACWDKLLTEEEKDAETHDVLFNVKRLLRANQQARGAYYQTALGGQAWMTLNEVREEEDLNPVDGGDEVPKKPLGGDGEKQRFGKGDKGKGDGDGADQEQPSEGAEPDGRQAAQLALNDGFRRGLKRLRHQAGRAALKPDKWVPWVDGLKDSAAPALELDLSLGCRLAGWREGAAARQAEAILGRLQAELLEAADCRPAELPSRVDAVFARWADRIMVWEELP